MQKKRESYQKGIALLNLRKMYGIYECRCTGKNLNGQPHSINSSYCMLLKSLYGNFLYMFPYCWDVSQ